MHGVSQTLRSFKKSWSCEHHQAGRGEARVSRWPDSKDF